MLVEHLPWAQSLSRMDKLRLIQVVAQDLAADEGTGIKAGHDYAIWSPDRAFDAADVMLRALAADRTRPDEQFPPGPSSPRLPFSVPPRLRDELPPIVQPPAPD